MRHYADAIAENGIAAVKDWLDRIAEVRALAARLLNASDPDDVYFVPNTTLGIGVIAEGFPWNSGDNIVLASEEYPSNQYPWMNLESRDIEVRRIASRGSRISIDDIRAAMDSRTRVLTVSSVEFASGFRNDLDAFETSAAARCLLLRRRDPIVGVFPLDVQKIRSTPSRPTDTSGYSARRGGNWFHPSRVGRAASMRSASRE